MFANDLGMLQDITAYEKRRLEKRSGDQVQTWDLHTYAPTQSSARCAFDLGCDLSSPIATRVAVMAVPLPATA